MRQTLFKAIRATCKALSISSVTQSRSSMISLWSNRRRSDFTRANINARQAATHHILKATCFDHQLLVWCILQRGNQRWSRIWISRSTQKSVGHQGGKTRRQTSWESKAHIRTPIRKVWLQGQQLKKLCPSRCLFCRTILSMISQRAQTQANTRLCLMERHRSSSKKIQS